MANKPRRSRDIFGDERDPPSDTGARKQKLRILVVIGLMITLILYVVIADPTIRKFVVIATISILFLSLVVAGFFKSD